jgi:hypothetical protein
MTTTTNLHHISAMVAGYAESNSGIGWLEMKDGRGNTVSVFMDYDMACEIADLWEAMNREPEPPTYDEALAAKCDADAALDEARKLKGM